MVMMLHHYNQGRRLADWTDCF